MSFTLVGADDIDRAPVSELRTVFGCTDPEVVCRATRFDPWIPLYDPMWDGTSTVVEWTER